MNNIEIINLDKEYLLHRIPADMRPYGRLHFAVLEEAIEEKDRDYFDSKMFDLFCSMLDIDDEVIRAKCLSKLD